MKKMVFIILGFILGFVSATYWKSGREIVTENAPTVKKHLKQGIDKGSKVIQDGANIAKDKIKDSL